MRPEHEKCGQWAFFEALNSSQSMRMKRKAARALSSHHPNVGKLSFHSNPLLCSALTGPEEFLLVCRWFSAAATAAAWLFTLLSPGNCAATRYTLVPKPQNPGTSTTSESQFHSHRIGCHLRRHQQLLSGRRRRRRRSSQSHPNSAVRESAVRLTDCP